jgi:hypothetical protein
LKVYDVSGAIVAVSRNTRHSCYLKNLWAKILTFELVKSFTEVIDSFSGYLTSTIKGNDMLSVWKWKWNSQVRGGTI